MPGRLPLGLMIILGISGGALWLHESGRADAPVLHATPAKSTGEVPAPIELNDELGPAPPLAKADSLDSQASDAPSTEFFSASSRKVYGEVASSAAHDWAPVARTTTGRDILTQSIGSGIQRVLVVAGMDGRDACAPELLDRLAPELRRQSHRPASGSYLLVRAANPDGLAVGQRCNSRDVDINYNFPTLGYEVSPALKTGPGPATEIETRVLLKLLAEFRPHRIVIVETGNVRDPELRLNEKATSLRHVISQSESPQIHEYGIEQAHGSLEEYADATMRSESVVLTLPAYSKSDVTWKRCGTLLVDVVTFDPSGRRLRELERGVHRDRDNLLDAPVANSRTPKPVPHPETKPNRTSNTRSGADSTD